MKCCIVIAMLVLSAAGCDQTGAGAKTTREQRDPIVTTEDRADAPEWRTLVADMQRDGLIYKMQSADDIVEVLIGPPFFELPIDAKETAANILFKLSRMDNPDCAMVKFLDSRSGDRVGSIDQLFGFDWDG